jgi:hypothetical protein
MSIFYCFRESSYILETWCSLHLCYQACSLIIKSVTLGGLAIIMLPTRPKVRGFKPSWERRIFKGDKSPCTSLTGEVKLVVPCCQIIRHVTDTYSTKKILVGKIHRTFSPRFSCFQLRVSAGYCQTAMVSESGMFKTQTGKYNRSAVVAVWGTPCAIAHVTVTVLWNPVLTTLQGLISVLHVKEQAASHPTLRARGKFIVSFNTIYTDAASKNVESTCSCNSLQWLSSLPSLFKDFSTKTDMCTCTWNVVPSHCKT